MSANPMTLFEVIALLDHGEQPAPWTWRSTRERARCRQRWFLLRPQGRRPQRWDDPDAPVAAR